MSSLQIPRRFKGRHFGVENLRWVQTLNLTSGSLQKLGMKELIASSFIL